MMKRSENALMSWSHSAFNPIPRSMGLHSERLSRGLILTLMERFRCFLSNSAQRAAVLCPVLHQPTWTQMIFALRLWAKSRSKAGMFGLKVSGFGGPESCWQVHFLGDRLHVDVDGHVMLCRDVSQ